MCPVRLLNWSESAACVVTMDHFDYLLFFFECSKVLDRVVKCEWVLKQSQLYLISFHLQMQCDVIFGVYCKPLKSTNQSIVCNCRIFE